MTDISDGDNGVQPEEIRASDAEREAVVAKLNTATSEGRLALDEFSERVDRAYQARTRGELGGMSRRGRWRVPENTVSVTVIGGLSMDLREAELAARDVTVTSVAVIGGLDVVVPSGMRVEVEGISLLGGRKVDVDERAASDAPTLRLRVFSIVGGVKVHSRRPADRSLG